jgi:AbiV family abortive infection protein
VAKRIAFQDVTDESTLRRWFTALVANAAALRTQADSLLRLGQAGRALALSVLALEETVKAAHLAELDEEHRTSGTAFVVAGATLGQWTHHRGKLPSAMLATALQRPDLLALFTPEDAFDELPPQDDPVDEALIRPLLELYVGIQTSASNLNRLKQRGLYVDLVAGQLTGPDDVSSGFAGAVLEAAEVCAEVVRVQVDSSRERLGPGPLDGA